MSSCSRKKMKTEGQAQVAARNAGLRDGVRRYPVFCQQCQAWHIVKGS